MHTCNKFSSDAYTCITTCNSLGTLFINSCTTCSEVPYNDASRSIFQLFYQMFLKKFLHQFIRNAIHMFLSEKDFREIPRQTLTGIPRGTAGESFGKTPAKTAPECILGSNPVGISGWTLGALSSLKSFDGENYWRFEDSRRKIGGFLGRTVERISRRNIEEDVEKKIEKLEEIPGRQLWNIWWRNPERTPGGISEATPHRGIFDEILSEKEKFLKHSFDSKFFC